MQLWLPAHGWASVGLCKFWLQGATSTAAPKSRSVCRGLACTGCHPGSNATKPCTAHVPQPHAVAPRHNVAGDHLNAPTQTSAQTHRQQKSLLVAARDDVAVITANPKTAGVARWIFLALWGAKLAQGKKAATKYVTKAGAQPSRAAARQRQRCRTAWKCKRAGVAMLGCSTPGASWRC